MEAEKYKYQYGFSEEHPDEMYNVEKRSQKGNKTLAVLLEHLEKEGRVPAELKILDIGC